MTQTTITKKINKATGEMQELIKKSKRKLLELEVLASLAEINQGKYSVFRKAGGLLKKL